MRDRPLIAAVHNTTASIAPLRGALAHELPGAVLWNLMDDRLGADADDAGGLDPRLRNRMLDLIRHGVNGGADAVLIACSMYGEVRAIAEKLLTTPVFASDSDMISEIAASAPRRVAVLASLQGSAADSTARITAALADTSSTSAEVLPVFCRGAADAAERADISALVEAFATELDHTGGEFDLVCIAQYSLSPAAAALADKIGVPVISPPRSAARAIAHRLTQS
ncbi:hypothetical protein M1247_03345 [Mycobacterium sp. 21AC1]|uniref:hypothetical protein n=1 Tax=[Mycobacterium] appelbergii TaxID=2939269 RepID=UPI002939059B|nr:hypothetical protein [Mycobacterium sp. 21AC1]MDV3123941.1 hypothetical protein [Mycobacterium sp. 21AC1]